MKSFKVLCSRCRHFVCRVSILKAAAGSVIEMELEYKCSRCRNNKAYQFVAQDKLASEAMTP